MTTCFEHSFGMVCICSMGTCKECGSETGGGFKYCNSCSKRLNWCGYCGKDVTFNREEIGIEIEDRISTLKNLSQGTPQHAFYYQEEIRPWTLLREQIDQGQITTILDAVQCYRDYKTLRPPVSPLISADITPTTHPNVDKDKDRDKEMSGSSLEPNSWIERTVRWFFGE